MQSIFSFNFNFKLRVGILAFLLSSVTAHAQITGGAPQNVTVIPADIISTPTVSGGIWFSTTSGRATTDSANLFYDSNTARVGIGTKTPAYRLDVQKNVADFVQKITNTTNSGNGLLIDTQGTNMTVLEADVDSAGSGTNTGVFVRAANGVVNPKHLVLWNTTGGDSGLPFVEMKQNNNNFSGNFIDINAKSSNQGTFTGVFESYKVNGSTVYYVDSNGGANYSGNLTVSLALTVTGAASLASNLTVSGNTNALASMTVTGPLTVFSSATILGSADATNAPIGYVGEYISTQPTVSQNLSNMPTAGIISIATTTLTAGDWECQANGELSVGNGTITQVEFAVSKTKNAFDQATDEGICVMGAAFPTGDSEICNTGSRRINTASTIPIFLTVQPVYAVAGTALYSSNSILKCRRMR